MDTPLPAGFRTDVDPSDHTGTVPRPVRDGRALDHGQCILDSFEPGEEGRGPPVAGRSRGRKGTPDEGASLGDGRRIYLSCLSSPSTGDSGQTWSRREVSQFPGGSGWEPFLGNHLSLPLRRGKTGRKERPQTGASSWGRARSHDGSVWLALGQFQYERTWTGLSTVLNSPVLGGGPRPRWLSLPRSP